MTNAAIYKTGTNTIKYFIKNCIKRGNDYIGSNKKILGLSDIFSIKWTNDSVNPIYKDGEIVGYDKTIFELSESEDNLNINKPNHTDYSYAFRIRKLLNNLTYEEVEMHIDNNITDLLSAKEYLKKLSKVVLALSVIIDGEMK